MSRIDGHAVSGVLLSLVFLLATPATAGDTSWPDLSAPPARIGGGEHDAAVIVGVENYLFLPDIPGALTNADDWYLYLTRTLAVPPARITLLRNDEATLEKLRKYVDRAASDVEPGGTLWFVFVGHGAASPDGDDGLLIGVDAQREADSVYARSLPRSELLTLLGGGRQERSAVVLDACFSGRGAGGEELVEGLQAFVPTHAHGIAGDVALMAAGRADQFAGPLPGEGRPAFSYLVLGALRGWGDADEDGSVTAGEAVSYARDALATLALDRDQTPELSGDLGEETLARGREAGPDLAAMRLALGSGSGIRTTGSATLSTGSDVDLAAAAAEAQRLRREREALEERERAIQRRLDEEMQRRRGEAEANLLESAATEWLALAPLIESPSPEVVDVVQMYVEKYAGAGVTVEGETTPVAVSQVEEAREWLRLHAGKRAGGGRAGDELDRHDHEMVRIEPGVFWMGSPDDEEDRDEDERQHRVQITAPFLMGETEVSQGLWEQVMGDNPAASRMRYLNGETHGACNEYDGESLVGRELPVLCVDWLDVVRFCNRLSESEGLDPAYRISDEIVTWDRAADGYRLPTEAEWEYAARAGSSGRFPGGSRADEVCEIANVADATAENLWPGWTEGFSCSDGVAALAPVGSYQPNEWGLYDMTGNVWEWLWDWYGEYPSGTATDPIGSSTGSFRTLRGGAWDGGPRYTRIALRGGGPPSRRVDRLGVRLARSIR